MQSPFAGALVAGFLLAGAAAAQDYVVTASPLAEPGPGRMIPAETVVSLAVGQTLELIGPGGPQRIEGPYDGAVGALLVRRERLTALGASRSGEATVSSETRFMLLADEAWCVSGPAPQLFLAPAKADRVVALIGAGGARAEIFWPAGAAVADWPAAAPFTPGARYRVAVGDVEMPGGFTLKPGPTGAGPAGAGPAAALAAFLDEGCLAQAEAAVAALAKGG